MNEMDNYLNEFFDNLFSEEKSGTIVLDGENGEEFEFVCVGVTMYGGECYAILKPTSPTKCGFDEGEALVFLIDTSSRSFRCIEDEELIDCVFKAYYDMLNAEDDEI